MEKSNQTELMWEHVWLFLLLMSVDEHVVVCTCQADSVHDIPLMNNDFWFETASNTQAGNWKFGLVNIVVIRDNCMNY